MAFLDSNKKKLITESISTWEKILQIKLISTGHKEDINFKTFSEELLSLEHHPKIEFTYKDSGIPGFKLKDNLFFSALPLERELEPFLDALKSLSVSESRETISSSIQEKLKKINLYASNFILQYNALFVL